MTSSPAHVHRLRVRTPQGESGLLAKTDDGYLFDYDSDASQSAEISLLMPHRLEPYICRELHPIFQMNLPEGYVLEHLRQRLAKTTPFDPMLLLALTGRDAAIGRVHVDAPTGFPAVLAPAETHAKGERLSEILAWDGAENLFDELAQLYLFRTGISGVQPKVLVPETPESTAKASLVTSDLIVKSGGTDFPGLAVNEFVCMSIAKSAGLPVPEFYLSDNQQLFVMRRFDRTVEGTALGFEELAVLMGKGAAQKYDGSYEQVAKFLSLFCSPNHRPAAHSQLFDQVVLSSILGNGDAHLKNFGVLYDDPESSDVWMAPAYDIVCTTAYIPNDSLALTFGGTKRLQFSDSSLTAFAKRCGVKAPRERVLSLLHAVEHGLSEHRALLEESPVVDAGIRRAFAGLTARFNAG